MAWIKSAFHIGLRTRRTEEMLMPTTGDDLRRVAAAFESFLIEAKPEHLDLFLPEIGFWRSHFPDGGGERMLDMRTTVDAKSKMPVPQAANIRVYLHVGGDSFTVAFEDVLPGAAGGRVHVPLCMIVSVSDGRITKFEEYFDAAFDPTVAWSQPGR
jgi:ketosteroid isomerase-like protein